MPILNVKISARKSPEMSNKIAALLLDLTSGILGKDPKFTSIAIDYVDPEDWIVAGRSLAEQGKSSVYFDVKVTDETNTKAEKARYIAAAFAGFEQLLGNLHPGELHPRRRRAGGGLRLRRKDAGVALPARLSRCARAQHQRPHGRITSARRAASISR